MTWVVFWREERKKELLFSLCRWLALHTFFFLCKMKHPLLGKSYFYVVFTLIAILSRKNRTYKCIQKWLVIQILNYKVKFKYLYTLVYIILNGKIYVYLRGNKSSSHLRFMDILSGSNVFT